MASLLVKKKRFKRLLKVITQEEYKQMKAFTRQDGFLMGLMWIISFVCFVFIYAMPSLSLLFDVMVLSIPVTLYIMTRRYRDNVMGGRMSFRRGAAYSFFVCFYAIIILALGQWVYFQFIDGGQFFQGMKQMFADAEYKQAFQQAGIDPSVFTDTVNMMSESRPIDIAISFVSQNIIFSCVISLLIGALCRKS